MELLLLLLSLEFLWIRKHQTVKEGLVLKFASTCQMVSHVLVVRQGHGMDQGGSNDAGPWRGLHIQRLPVLPLRTLQIRILVNKRNMHMPDY